MKKLLLLMLVLYTGVGSMSATGLTIYMKANNWTNDSPGFAVWNHSTSTFIEFENIRDDYYKAELPDGFTAINLVRYNPANASVTDNWDSKGVWSQSDDITPAATNNFFIFTDNWNHNNTGKSEFNWLSAQKVYVKNMEGSEAVKFFAKETSGWVQQTADVPGDAMTSETISSETWYSYVNLSGINTLFGKFSIADGDYKTTGDISIDLSSSDKYYYYYPSKYQAVLNSEALATPAKVHFRVDKGESTNDVKWYMWNSDGLRSDIYTTESAGGVDWITFETYKPSFSIQFYSYNNGDADSDNDKCYGKTLSMTAGEESYYFTALPRKNIAKYEGSYSIAYWSGSETWLANNLSVSTIAMEADGDFQFKATIDNTAGNHCRYVITPTSSISEGKLVDASNAITASSGNFSISSFDARQSSAFPGRWTYFDMNDVPYKFDVTFNFATMTWTSTPYHTTTIGSAGYTTWSNGEKYKVSGATAYTVTDMGTYARLNEQSADIVYPAGTGLILGGSGEVTISAVAPDAEAASMSGNDLLGSGNSSAAISAGSYVLYWNGSDPATVGFKQTTAGTLAAHKAYLPAGGGSAPEFLGFNFGDMTPTDINSVKREEIKDKSFFNLAGQRVANPTKGLYIVNGKKVVIK